MALVMVLVGAISPELYILPAAAGLLSAGVGRVLIIVAAFRKSVGWGLAALVVPFGGLAFVLIHWKEAGRPFKIMLAGLALVFVAVAMAPPKESSKGASKTQALQVAYDEDVQRRFDAARALLDSGDLEGAEKAFDFVLALADRRADAWYFLGVAKDRQGNVSGALQAYSEAINRDPKHVNAYTNRGMIWKNKGELARAVADFDKALEIDPESRNARINRTELQERQPEK